MKPKLHSSLVYFTQMESVSVQLCVHNTFLMHDKKNSEWNEEEGKWRKKKEQIRFELESDRI